MKNNKEKLINRGKEIIIEELDNIRDNVIDNLDENLANSIEIILNTKGKLIIIGMGKSGLIGAKQAATFASTGTPSFSIHPGEALHGDLGMISEEDNLLLLSFSGETEEMLKILPALNKLNNKKIAITGNPKSTLALFADCHLNVAIDKEVCPNNLAPTTSTTATLIMGDVLATILMELRDFQPLDFAKYHPGGSLGRKLLNKVKDEMTSKHLPFVNIHKDIKTLILTMSNSFYGLAIIRDDDEKLVGIVTDGDLRRAWNDYESLKNQSISNIMNTEALSVNQDEPVIVGEEIMQNAKINNLLVTDDYNNIIGILQIF